MASHGGMREGSGRPSGAGNKATSELKLNLSELAREYTNNALDTLVEVMQSSHTYVKNRSSGNPSWITGWNYSAT